MNSRTIIGSGLRICCREELEMSVSRRTIACSLTRRSGLGKTGTPWRDLPERFGKWKLVFQQFNLGSQKGVWDTVIDALSEKSDLEWLLTDSTIIRAHAQRACNMTLFGPSTPNSTDRVQNTQP